MPSGVTHVRRTASPLISCSARARQSARDVRGEPWSATNSRVLVALWAPPVGSVASTGLRQGGGRVGPLRPLQRGPSLGDTLSTDVPGTVAERATGPGH